MEGLSLKPSDATVGGFLDDVDVTIAEARFTVWDYQGKAAPTIALRVSFEDQEGGTHQQYYSCGDPTKLHPSTDGRAIVALVPGVGINQGTNAIAFISSLVNAGFPEDRLTNDVQIFDGLQCHVNQVAQPKRPGLKDQKDKTYLLVTKILRLPWEAAPPKASRGAPKTNARPTPVPAPVATTAPTPSPAPVGEASGERVEKARGVVLQVLMEKGGTLAKTKLPTECFRAMANDADRNAVVQLVFQEGFLSQSVHDGAFNYDGQNVSLPA